MDPLARLEARSREVPCLVKGLDLPCWVARSTGHDYSRVMIEGRTQYAHRVAYREMIDDLPDGLEPDHLCRMTRCWNPYHLDPVTRSVNILRGRLPEVTKQRLSEHVRSLVS